MTGDTMKAGIYGGRMFVPYLLAPGGRWSDRIPRPEQQVFSFHKGSSGEVLHFDIERLWQLIREHQPPFDLYPEVEASLEAEEVAFVRRTHGIEAAHLKRLTAARLEEPGILCDYGDGSSILVDGNHRYVRRFDIGHKTMRFIALQRDQWRLCLLDIPNDVGLHLATADEPAWPW